jgi:hypothetical protein
MFLTIVPISDTVGNSTESTTVDGINLDEIKEFAKQFKIRRLSIGLTQTQVGQALSATEGPAYSQVCHLQVNSIAILKILLIHYLPGNIELIFNSYDRNVHLSEIFLSLVQHTLFHKSSLKPLNQIWVKLYFHNDIIG